MKSVPVPTQTVDMETGRVVKEEITRFDILPPPPGACAVCAHNPAHPPDQPHNAQSLYYQYAFYGEHGRWPTWKDAVAHSPDQVKARWEQELRKVGKWSEPA